MSSLSHSKMAVTKLGSSTNFSDGNDEARRNSSSVVMKSAVLESPEKLDDEAIFDGMISG